MHFIAEPDSGPLLSIAYVEVIGGVDELSRRQDRFCTPLSALLSWLELLLPHGAQRAESGQRFHPIRGVRCLQCSEEHPAVGSHLVGIRFALLLLFRQTFMLQPLTIALNPLDWHMGAHPIGRYLREYIQDIDHGLSHTQRAVEGADLGQDMGRVGALSPSGFEPPTFAAALQEQIQQTLFSISRNQTRAKFGKHGM